MRKDASPEKVVQEIRRRGTVKLTSLDQDEAN